MRSRLLLLVGISIVCSFARAALIAISLACPTKLAPEKETFSSCRIIYNYIRLSGGDRIEFIQGLEGNLQNQSDAGVYPPSQFGYFAVYIDTN